MQLIRGLIAFLGRFCLSIIFISSSIHQMLNWQETLQSMTTTLADLESLTVAINWVQPLLSFSLNSTSTLLGLAIFCQLIGGLCILLGIQVRLGAFLLIAFLAPATLAFHHFWLLQGPDQQVQMIEFMKNLSIFGGLLILLAYGKCKRAQHDEVESSKG